VKWFGGTGMFSRQDWVEVRRAAAGGAGLPQAPKARSPRAPIKFWISDCRKRVFQAFQALSSYFEGVGNSRKRWGELDSDPKMNQTERWLPVQEQPRSAVDGSSESTCDQLKCSPTEWIIEKLHCNIYYSTRNFAVIKYNTAWSTLTRGTPRPQTKSSFIPDKCRLARQLTDETTPYSHPDFRHLGKWLFSQFRAIFIFSCSH